VDRLLDGSGMNREVHVPFCESLQGRFLRSTHHKLHWSLDVALREDACKIHRGYAAENLARVRHIALNYLKGETNFKGGIRRKQKKAALDENYLAAILAV